MILRKKDITVENASFKYKCRYQSVIKTVKYVNHNLYYMISDRILRNSIVIQMSTKIGINL
jgi:hypothetical protein